MKIGIVGVEAPDSFADNMHDALARIGHEVTMLGAAHTRYPSRVATRGVGLVRQGLTRLDEHMQRRLAVDAEHGECDVVINVDIYLHAEPVARMRRAGIKVAFWFPDHIAHLGRQLMLLAPYNAIFFKEPHLVKRIQALLDIPAFYLPESCNPRWHRPLTPAGSGRYLVVAGTMYPFRVRLLERLLEKGVPLRIYGPPLPRWMGESSVRDAHTGTYVTKEEKARVYRSAAGVLNAMYPAEVEGVNGRLFQATGCGAAVLSEYRPTLPDLFEVGTEVLTYSDFDELLFQASRLLDEKGLTAKVGDAAARRAHRDHTYDRRVATILAALE